MASYNELNALIDAYINRNGVQAITGQILNGVLKAMVEQLGRGYTIMGAATPTTDPGTPDGPECYFASETGTYTDFDGLQVVPGELALLCYTPTDGWMKNTIYEGFQTVNATIDGNVGTPSVGVSYANGVLSFDFHNMKGNTGDPAGFGTIGATVDGNIGTPGVTVSESGPNTAKNLTFAFTNLKGETGVTSVLATVDNTVGTPQCAVSLVGQQLTLAFTGLKGAQGNTGSSVDYPFEIVNNLTTNDATKALSAAMGVQLESEVSQLEAKVSEIIDLGSWNIGSMYPSSSSIPDYASTTRLRMASQKTISKSGNYTIVCNTGYLFLIYVVGKITTASWENKRVVSLDAGDIYRIAIKTDTDTDFSAYTQEQVDAEVSSSGIIMYGGVIVQDLKDDIDKLDAKVDGNPFTKMHNNELSTNYSENSYVDTSNGNFVAHNGWARSGYINVSLFESLVINTNRASVYNGFYDKDKSFIRSFSLIVGDNNVSVPDNACFIVISNTSADVKTTAIVIGKYRYATKNDIDQSTTMFRSVSYKTLPGLTVDNYGKILSVSSSYYILYYKAEADCVVRLSYTRADSYVYDGKIFIAPESSLVVDAYVSVLTQVSQNANSDKMYTLSAGQCLCVTYRTGDTANFYLGESVLEQAKFIDSRLPKYGIEGVNLVRINAIQNNSIVNGTTGKIVTDNNGWRAIEIDFCQDDVRIFMNKIWSGYYSFIDANGNVLLVQGNNYNLYWGYKIPKGAVKGRFSINANVSDADIASYCYISYGRPLMQDEISNRVSFENSFSYAKNERPTDYDGGDITAFMKILCIGDSITRGYFNSTDGGVNIPGMTYPDNLARETGCDVTNLGDSGESTASWWTAHQNDTELTGAKCVIIELGINDNASTLDTTTKDAMDAIIAKLKTENQKVKIFLSGIPSGKSYPARLDTDSYYVKDQWLRNYYATYFANDAQVFFLDIARYTHICEKKAETYDDYNQGHLSEYGYWRLAKDYANYISYLMYNSDNTFKEIQFIGTDYSRT